MEPSRDTEKDWGFSASEILFRSWIIIQTSSCDCWESMSHEPDWIMTCNAADICTVKQSFISWQETGWHRKCDPWNVRDAFGNLDRSLSCDTCTSAQALIEGEAKEGSNHATATDHDLLTQKHFLCISVQRWHNPQRIHWFLSYDGVDIIGIRFLEPNLRPSPSISSHCRTNWTDCVEAGK